MTKAPTTERSELHPWLHTVIKHEALALRRQRERLLAGGDGEAPERLGTESARSAEEDASQRERAAQTAEALGGLKAGEVKCLLLKALGYSYDEISARTGFSWTKVNRSLTEGRKRFFDRFDEIQSGEQCARFHPLLSAASDGETSTEDRQRLESHLRSCHRCRALLRGYRAVPQRLAELLPPVTVLQTLHRDGWWSRLSAEVIGGLGERVAAAGHKLQQLGEAATAQKATAVVASTAAIAGGAVVSERSIEHRVHRHHRNSAHVRGTDAAERKAAVATAEPTSSSSETVEPASPPAPTGDAHMQAPTEPTPAAEASSTEEFVPEATAPSGPSASPAAVEPKPSSPQQRDMRTGSGQAHNPSTAEFGP